MKGRFEKNYKKKLATDCIQEEDVPFKNGCSFVNEQKCFSLAQELRCSWLV
jgi:hypothetical protein